MKCAVYARVSTQNDSQKTSIPAQIQLFDNFIKEQGWELFKVYSDVKSGSKSNRDGIQQLIKDAKSKKFDVVVAKEISRISRNGEFSYEFKTVLDENQIDFITLDGAINTLKDRTDSFGLYVWLSETEAKRTSARIKTSYEVRAKQGYFDEAPYGYDLNKGKLHISDDGSAEIVKRIYKEYIEGKSFDAIGRALFNEDILTPSARKGNKNAGVFWHGSTIRQILEREIYTGCLVAKKTSIISPKSHKRNVNGRDKWIIREDTHEPIISKEDFLLVQQLMQKRKRIRSQQKTHLFTGILECASCGALMHFKRDRYVCGYQNKYGKKACSYNFRPVESKLISLILDDLNSLCFENLKQSSLEKFVDSELEKDLKNINREIVTIKNKLSQLRKRKEKLLEKLLDEAIDQTTYDSYLAKLNPDIDQLVDKLKTLNTTETEVSGTFSDFKSYLLKQLTTKKPISKLDATTLAKFIHKIIVKADGQLEVHYRTSKPAAFYVSTNIQLPIPKNRRKNRS